MFICESRSKDSIDSQLQDSWSVFEDTTWRH